MVVEYRCYAVDMHLVNITTRQITVQKVSQRVILYNTYSSKVGRDILPKLTFIFAGRSDTKGKRSSAYQSTTRVSE